MEYKKRCDRRKPFLKFDPQHVLDLLERYTVPEPNTGCRLWTLSMHPTGYGKAHYNYKNYQTHRLSYLASKGSIPEGLFVCHKCDTPACCNPDHLWLGTHKDNMADASKKGRMRSGKDRRGVKG